MKDVGRGDVEDHRRCRPGRPARRRRTRGRSGCRPGTRSATATAGRSRRSPAGWSRRRCRRLGRSPVADSSRSGGCRRHALDPDLGGRRGAEAVRARGSTSRASSVWITPKTKIARASTREPADHRPQRAAPGGEPRAARGRGARESAPRRAISAALTSDDQSEHDHEHHPVGGADRLGVRRVRLRRARAGSRGAGAAAEREREQGEGRGEQDRPAAQGGAILSAPCGDDAHARLAARAPPLATLYSRRLAPLRPSRRSARPRCGRPSAAAAAAALVASVAVPAAPAPAADPGGASRPRRSSPAPLAVAVLRPRTRGRDVVLFTLQMWGFAIAHELPYDDPEALRGGCGSATRSSPTGSSALGELPNVAPAAALSRPGRVTGARPRALDRPLGVVHGAAPGAALRPGAPPRSLPARRSPDGRHLRHRLRALLRGPDRAALVGGGAGSDQPAVERVTPRWPGRGARGAPDHGRRRRAGLARRLGAALRIVRRQPVGGDAVASLRHLADGGDPAGRGRPAAGRARLGATRRRSRFALVYLGEHYVTDLLAGAALVAVVRRGEPVAEPAVSAVNRRPAAARADRRRRLSGIRRRAACEDQAPDGVADPAGSRRGMSSDPTLTIAAESGSEDERTRTTSRRSSRIRSDSPRRPCSSSCVVVGDLRPVPADRRDRGRDSRGSAEGDVVWIAVAFAFARRDVRLLRRPVPRRGRRARSS